LPERDYVLRVRHRALTSAGVVESAWAERRMRTAALREPNPELPNWVAPEGYAVERFATGFVLPVNIAFVPEPAEAMAAPYFYVTELYGRVRVVARDGSTSTYADELLDFYPGGVFPGAGERGLAGILVEPSSGDLIVTLMRLDGGGGTVGSIVRLTSSDGGRTASASQTLLELEGEPQSPSHQVSHVSIGPDGFLYVHSGDGMEPNAARDLTQWRGKILRMTLGGAPVPSNPYYDAADGITPRDYVFASGLRNPFGGTWRVANGQHYFVENGPEVDRFARVERGWDFGYDGSNQSMRTHALYLWDPAVAPVNLVFLEPEVFHGSGFGPEYLGSAFVTESGATYGAGPGKMISELRMEGERVVERRPFVAYNGEGRSTVAGLAAGPDGLYFTDLYAEQGNAPDDPGAAVYRVYRVP
jgi:glucose/arabinose dehydrogenase